MDDILLNKAFVVEEITEDFDPSIPPSDGHEYLQHVMYEASKCPQVVVANIDRRKLKNYVDIQLETGALSCSSELLPSQEWQCQQVSLFSELRKKLKLCKKSDRFKAISLPNADSEEKWYDICFGNSDLVVEPSLTIMFSMNEPLLGRILEYQAEWLNDGLKPNQGKWIYALLACLDLPLTSITCSAVRDLARKCGKIRCTKTSSKDNDLLILNLIICLVSKYFGQTDLET